MSSQASDGCAFCTPYPYTFENKNIKNNLIKLLRFIWGSSYANNRWSSITRHDGYWLDGFSVIHTAKPEEIVRNKSKR